MSYKVVKCYYRRPLSAGRPGPTRRRERARSHNGSTRLCNHYY